MSEGGWRKKLVWTLAVLAVLLAVVFVPPLVNVNRYRTQITRLLSTSLGRPVHLAAVEARLFPRPGFELTDLTVDEDPQFGAEPLLHASTVKASLRLLPLWRGKLEIDSISVDEASLNLVRTPADRWNFQPLLGMATGDGKQAAEWLPTLDATHARINIKNGVEKLPFSLVNAKLSFWQQKPGEWRLQLRGQPARTDLVLDLADTGEVRLDASLSRAAELRKMPLHVELHWREAQLGQLARLLVGTDPGWRGALNGEAEIDGSAETAQIKARLKADGVHREEFAPAEPLDFDARCALVYHSTQQTIENLRCDSPLGSGRIRVEGELPAADGQRRVAVELDRIPATVGLDALRTLRRGFAPGLTARGSISGSLNYAPMALLVSAPASTVKKGAHPVPPVGPLTGALTVDGLELNGGGLGDPLRLPKLTLASTLLAAADGKSAPTAALTTTVALPAGALAPLNATLTLASSGYQLALHGQAAIARARELIQLAGAGERLALSGLAGDPLVIDLTASGPWLLAEKGSMEAASAPVDSLNGTVQLRNANWKPDYLANALLISQATLHLGPEGSSWTPVAFTYGPLKGTATLTQSANCALTPCVPHFEVVFGPVSGGLFQAAFLGASKPDTVLAKLIERLRPSAATPAWPVAEGTVRAEALTLGPVVLHTVSATLRLHDNRVEIDRLEAGLLGGVLTLNGAIDGATAQQKPVYTLAGRLDRLNPNAVAALMGLHATGGSFTGDGKITLSGFTGAELAASARGSLNFDWRKGSIAAAPAAINRFDRWSGTAAIGGGGFSINPSQVVRGGKSAPFAATVGFGTPARLSVVLTPAKP